MPPSRPIIVVGAINIDFVVRSPTLPAPGHTVAGRSFSTAHGGKGANQAHTAAVLGAEVGFVGRVGADDHGTAALAALSSSGVDVTGIVESDDQPTGVAFVQVDDAGENAITTVAGANGQVHADDVTRVFAAYAGRDPIVVLGYEVPIDAVAHAASAARSAGWTVVLNPAPVTTVATELYTNVDVLVPNEHELAALGSIDSLMQRGVDAVVVTLGGDGTRVHQRGGRDTVHTGEAAVDVHDTTGAGDAFIGALVWSLSLGHDLTNAVELASAAGAIATQSAGARSSAITVEAISSMVAARR